MDVLVFVAVYCAIGVGVFAWTIRSCEMMSSYQKKRSAKMFILFPELCLFWPVALLSEIKRRRAASQVVDNHSD